MPPSDSTKWMMTSAIVSRVRRYARALARWNQRDSHTRNGNDASVTSASGRSSHSRIPATDSTDSAARTRSSRAPSTSSEMLSTSLVSRAMTRPEVNRSWKPIDSFCRWRYTRTRRSSSTALPTRPDIARNARRVANSATVEAAKSAVTSTSTGGWPMPRSMPSFTR